MSQHEVAKTRCLKRVRESEARGRVAPLSELDEQMFQPGKIPAKERRDERPQVRLVDQQADAADAITALGQEREPQPFFAFHRQPARLCQNGRGAGLAAYACAVIASDSSVIPTRFTSRAAFCKACLGRSACASI